LGIFLSLFLWDYGESWEVLVWYGRGNMVNKGAGLWKVSEDWVKVNEIG
jgi:hypothetical protein